MNQAILFTDGASKSNPGEASIGVYADLRGLNSDLRGNKKQEYEWFKAIGKATNNEAEYQAMIFGLKKLKATLGGEKAQKIKVLIKSDSQLITSQLRGEFKLKEPEFFPLFIEIWNLKQEFASVDWETIPREQNQRADKLANQALSQDKLFSS